MAHQDWKTFSVNDILASNDRRLRTAKALARTAKGFGLTADLLGVPLQQAYENALVSFAPPPTVTQSDILECLSVCIGALDDAEEAEEREIQYEARIQAEKARAAALQQAVDAWKEEKEALREQLVEKIEKLESQYEARIQAEKARADANDKKASDFAEEADAFAKESDAINKLRREERSYEKAQILGLLIKGGCNARGMLATIQEEIVDNLKLDHLKEPESAEETWQTMFNANESLLDVAKLVAKLDGKTISSAEDAAEEVSDIQKCLSDENIDWSRSLGRNSLGNFVCIPTPLLTKGQATLVYEMAKVYRYPAEIVDKDGQVIEI